MRAVFAWVGAAIAAVLVFLLLFFATNIFSQKTANFRGETSKRNQVEANGSFRVGAYERLFDECKAVMNDEVQIKELTEELKTVTKGSESESQIRTFLTASKIARVSDINTYNLDVRKTYTVGQFKDPSLPYQLDPTNEVTTC